MPTILSDMLISIKMWFDFDYSIVLQYFDIIYLIWKAGISPSTMFLGKPFYVTDQVMPASCTVWLIVDHGWCQPDKML